MTASSLSFAGIALDRPRLMGILNLTPDSLFAASGDLPLDQAVALGLRLVGEGAAIIDVGGESTRPGATPVPPPEEQHRILKVIEGLARAGVVVSVDTRNAATMRAAIAAGARIVNDVTALTHDPASLGVLAASEASVVLMHSRGTPQDMNRLTEYQDVVGEVAEYLADRAQICLAAGIGRNRIALDPGIGFAKTAVQSVALLDGIAAILDLGFPVLVGASRKSFLKHIAGGDTAAARLGASLGVAVEQAKAGVHLLRVHDVAATAQALETAGVAGVKGA